MKAWMSSARRLVRARPWISAAAALVVAGGATAGYLLTASASSAQAQATVTSRLVAAATGTVRQSVSTTGTLTPADEDDVNFASSAEVTSVRVAVGDRVTKGQVLGTIDPLALQSSLAQAQATLAQAQAALSDAQDSGTATSAQLSADEASVATAQASVSAAQTALDGATLRSPITGTVAAVNVTTGQVASGSSGSGGSSPSATGNSGNGRNGANANSSNASSSSSASSTADFVVVGLKKWTVSAGVDDTEVGLIKRGDQVQLTTDGASGPIFGTVGSVSVLASTSSGSASYPVTIDVTGTPSGLHDGESVTASIIYRQLSNVLTVPSAAVHTANGTSYVYVDSGGKRVKRTVGVGLSSGGTAQITSGLTAGDQVYVDVATGTRRTGTTGTGGTGRNGGGFFGGGGLGGGGFGGGGLGGGTGGFVVPKGVVQQIQNGSGGK